MARFTRQRIIEEVVVTPDSYAIQPYPDPQNVAEADRHIEQYRAKVEAGNQEIIDAHNRGDHETGDAIRPKVAIIRRDLERLLRQKGIFERQ